MPETSPPNLNFFVYIIESPSAQDLYRGTSEASGIAEVLKLDSIPCITRTAIHHEALIAALRLGLPEAMKEYPDRIPILHLSAHGFGDGIVLSTGAIVTWDELRQLLVPVNESLQGCLILCMSACQGYSACRMAMQIEDAPHPYWVMIGSGDSPTWSDTSVSYLTFYHLLKRGQNIPIAVAAMSSASGVDWLFETAANSKQVYIDYVREQLSLPAAREQLETVAEREQLPPSAKGLENG